MLGATMSSAVAKARFLMCRPEYFAVSYVINPWMDPQSWACQHQKLTSASRREWSALRHTLLGLGAAVELLPPVHGLPDLVFTANAAIVLDRKVLLAHFRHPERQREEPHFEAAFRSLHARGLVDIVRRLPEGLVQEGAGDCVWDSARNLFWMGYGSRSDHAARYAVEDTFAAEVIALELADPRFYHIDTALCPLPGGELLYFPSAFTAAGRTKIRDQLAPSHRIEVTLEDARGLSANAVAVGNTVVFSHCSRRLRLKLEQLGYRILERPLSSFRRSGGAAFCLTLRLDHRSAMMSRSVHDAARLDPYIIAI